MRSTSTHRTCHGKLLLTTLAACIASTACTSAEDSLDTDNSDQDGPVRAAEQPLGTDVFISTTVPRYSEFGPENPHPSSPGQYYWCGHAALKSVGAVIASTTKTLNSLHNTFYNNSSAGYGADNYCTTSGVHWCASLQDLQWAATKSQNGGYGRGLTVRRDIARGNVGSENYAGFFTQIMGGVNAGYPAIIPSNWYYGNAGHFWIVTGYKDMGDYSTSQIYLRDVAMSEVASPATKYDKAVSVKTFFDNTKHSGNLIQILYMK